jgi:hypothetical protein
MRLLTPLTSVVLALAACGSTDSGLSLPEPQLLVPPAGPEAAQPFVAAAAAGITLSWTEPTAVGHALRFATWDGTDWSVVRTAAEGTEWFVNWADFPSVVPLSDRDLVAHWLQRSGPGRYAYDVMLTRSVDGGDSWSPPVRPHRDGTETEHGFASLFPHDGGVGVVWLDGRRYEDGPAGPASNEMQVRFTSLGAGGMLTGELVIDERVCDCCQTAVAHTTRGPLVFYRDRSADEIRDIAVSRLENGRWTQPQLVHADNWSINACPVNGPAADAADGDVAVAWYTGAADTPRVRIAFSSDAGDSFGPPITVDDGYPIGRVDVLLLEKGRALVVWLERVGEDAEVRARLIDSRGERGPARTIAATTAGRSGGFPRMARRDADVVLAWTEPGESSTVRAAVLQLPRR